MIAWMMGGRRVGMIPISTSINTIDNLSNIEQGRVIDILNHTSMYCTFTPTIYSPGGRVASMGHMFKYFITNHSISWKSQQSTTFNLVRGVIVSVWRPISTSPFNMNSCSLIAIGRVSGILWLRSTYINIYSAIMRGRVAGHTWPTSTVSVITWGIVAGIKRRMSMNLLTQRHFNILFFRNFVVNITTTGIRITGITRPIS